MNSENEGLRRLGVAVAVWGAMAAARRVPPTPSERVASGMVRVLRTLLAEAEAELDAERAARRKWELRLRVRANRSYYPDRLLLRVLLQPASDAPLAYLNGAPIAGPRGVLP